MARRLLACALAFVVIGVPLAGDICETVCAEHAGQSSDWASPASHHHHADSQPSHHHHSSAAPAPADQNTAFRPPPHQCSRLEAVVTESRESTRPPIVKAVVTMAGLTPLVAPVLRMSELDSRPGPRAPIRSTSLLRI
jgi:hypothetical protein